MSNELTTLQLPAHILSAFAGNAAIASIGEGLVGSHPKIGLSGTNKEFFLKETGVETSLGGEINVLVVGINPNKSIVVYGKKYDRDTDPEAPLFSSDDGTPVPNELATKVISESRRWAVLLADNPNGPVYELRLPAASIFRGDTYRDMLAKRGAPIAAVVTKITFDPAEKYARYVFTPTSYVSVEQAAAITKVAGSIEVDSILGFNRKPVRQVLPASAAQPTPQIAEAPNEAPKRPRARATAPVTQPAASTLAFPSPGQQTAAQKVIVNPTVADADLENTIANVLKL